MSDDPTILYVAGGGLGETARAAVEQVGGVPVEATDGVDALKRLDYLPADLVVVPATLPDIPLDVFVGRAADERSVGPPVVVGTVDRAPGPMIQLPADVPVDALADRMQRALRNRRLGDELDRHERLKEAFLRTAGTVVDVLEPGGVERVVYEALNETDAYRFVWVGRYDPDADAIDFERPIRRTCPVDDVGAFAAGGDASFISRAIVTGAVTVADGPVAAGDGAADDLVLTSIPLYDGKRTRGVVILATEPVDAPDGTERSLLARIGRLGGLALAYGSTEAGTTVDRVDGLHRALDDGLRNQLQFASLSLETAREEGDRAALERAAMAVASMESIIETAGALSAGGGVATVEPTDVHELAVSMFRDVGGPAAELVGGEPVTVEADPTLLERLLSDLLGDVIERAGPGASVRIGKLSDATGFYVECDGPVRPRNESTSTVERGRTADGTGFGIARAIADAHGWKISAVDGSENEARFEVVADAAEAPRDDLAALFDEGSAGFIFPEEPRVE